MFLLFLKRLGVILIIRSFPIQLSLLLDFIAPLLQKLTKFSAFLIVKLVLTHRQLVKVDVIALSRLHLLTLLRDHLQIVLELGDHVLEGHALALVLDARLLREFLVGLFLCALLSLLLFAEGHFVVDLELLADRRVLKLLLDLVGHINSLLVGLLDYLLEQVCLHIVHFLNHTFGVLGRVFLNIDTRQLALEVLNFLSNGVFREVIILAQ